MSTGAVVAMVVLVGLLGAAIGFALGRSEDAGPAASAPITAPAPTPIPPGDTIPPVAPSPAPSAPPGSELPTTPIGTAENPIPVGQSYILGLYEIEVLGADLDAADALAAFDPSNPAPPPGRLHALVEVRIAFTDANGLGNPATIPFFLSDTTAEWYDFEQQCGSIPDPIARAGFLEGTEEAVGNICFTIADDPAGPLLFGTEGFAGPVYFALPG